MHQYNKTPSKHDLYAYVAYIKWDENDWIAFINLDIFCKTGMCIVHDVLWCVKCQQRNNCFYAKWKLLWRLSCL